MSLRKTSVRRHKQNVLRALKSWVDVLKVNFDIELVILHGSFARNDWNISSDADVIIVGNIPGDFFIRMSNVKKLWNWIVPMDVFVYTSDEFIYMRDDIFIKEAMKKSKVLYQKCA